MTAAKTVSAAAGSAYTPPLLSSTDASRAVWLSLCTERVLIRRAEERVADSDSAYISLSDVRSMRLVADILPLLAAHRAIGNVQLTDIGDIVWEEGPEGQRLLGRGSRLPNLQGGHHLVLHTASQCAALPRLSLCSAQLRSQRGTHCPPALFAACCLLLLLHLLS